jgi:hypothetical protein
MHFGYNVSSGDERKIFVIDVHIYGKWVQEKYIHKENHQILEAVGQMYNVMSTCVSRRIFGFEYLSPPSVIYSCSIK